MRRLKQDEIVGNPKGFGFVKRPVIDLEDVEGIGIRLKELVEKKLVAVAVDRRKLPKERLASRWFYRTVEPKGFALPLPLPQHARSHYLICHSLFSIWYSPHSALCTGTL